jgi:hypothetical protein
MFLGTMLICLGSVCYVDTKEFPTQASCEAEAKARVLYMRYTLSNLTRIGYTCTVVGKSV